MLVLRDEADSPANLPYLSHRGSWLVSEASAGTGSGKKTVLSRVISLGSIDRGNAWLCVYGFVRRSASSPHPGINVITPESEREWHVAVP